MQTLFIPSTQTVFLYRTSFVVCFPPKANSSHSCADTDIINTDIINSQVIMYQTMNSKPLHYLNQPVDVSHCLFRDDMSCKFYGTWRFMSGLSLQITARQVPPASVTSFSSLREKTCCLNFALTVKTLLAFFTLTNRKHTAFLEVFIKG